jgi:predicted phosphodiesterase
MILGIISDTHKEKMNALPHIMADFKKRGVEMIIHCGDIEPEHIRPELFNNLPVICALIEEQIGKKEFSSSPKNWKFTVPGERICDAGDIRLYVGHKRGFEFLTGSEANLIKKLSEIRKDHSNVRFLFAGHVHHQIYKQDRLISFINPGAVEMSFDGYEYAIVNTEIDEVTFSRISKTKSVKKTFKVGVISDSLEISDIDVDFWKKLAEEFEKRGVKDIIHCGNIAMNDIGRPEFEKFQIHYNLRSDQKDTDGLKNWQLISKTKPVVEINGYRFYVQLDLGATLLEQSEYDMHKLCLNLRRKYPEINYVLCGFTNDAFYEEGEQVRIVNPGDAVKDRNFTVISLPNNEITFAHVPVDPLPNL